jgi:hypothetical protein
MPYRYSLAFHGAWKILIRSSIDSMVGSDFWVGSELFEILKWKQDSSRIVWRKATNCRSHRPPLQDAQGSPQPDIWQPPWTTQPPGHPEQATASHQSHRVCRAEADPWASGDDSLVWERGSQMRSMQQGAWSLEHRR